MSDLDTTQQESTEVLDLPAPNEGEDGTLDSMPARTSVARWYAVQVASSCEKKVKATLEQRAVTLGVSNRILEIEITETTAIKVKKTAVVNPPRRRYSLATCWSGWSSMKTQ